MVRIKASHLGLVYRVRRPLSLALRQHGLQRPGHTGPGDRRRQSVTALAGIDFEAKAGDRLGLVGSNGAGKTTLLNVLYGIYEPTSGKVEVEGRVDALFNINLGFRREATGRRNILLRGLVNGRTPEEMARREDDIIAFSELGDFIDMPMKTYSQGMAARLAFSIATSLEPEILLMDEWIGAGDRQFQDKARGRMAALAEAAGIVVLATHNQQLLKATCNRILAIEGGRVAFFGSADEYFDQKVSAK